MRTDQEIIDRIKSVKDDDPLGFERSDLLAALPFTAAKALLGVGAKEEEWGEPVPRGREAVVARMLDYMPFAWDKANNKRGISASRSMSHYRAWMWLAGDDPDPLHLLDYEHYGKEKLVAICQVYAWDSTQWDDGVREND